MIASQPVSRPGHEDRRAYDPYLLDDRMRYQLLQVAHANNVVLVDEEGVIRYASPSAVRHFGSIAVDRPFLSLLHRQDVLNTLSMFERLQVGRQLRLEWVTRLRSSGRWTWFKARATRFGYGPAKESVVAVFFKPLGS